MSNEGKSRHAALISRLSDRAMVRNVMLVGGTGYDRQEIYLTALERQIGDDGGAIFACKHTDIQSMLRVRDLCRKYNRERDLYVLDFRTPEEQNQSDKTMPVQRFNPFAQMNHRQLTQMLISLMDDVGGDTAIWKGRAIAMLTPVIRALVWLRDNKGWDLSPSFLKNNLSFHAVLDLLQVEGLPSEIFDGVDTYLRSLPSYDEHRGHRQSVTTLDQHGYLEMQFTKILFELTGEFETRTGIDSNAPPEEIVKEGTTVRNVESIDFKEVISQRRIVVVLFPQFMSSPSSEAFENIVFRAICNTLAEGDPVMKLACREKYFMVISDSVYNARNQLAMLAKYGRNSNIGLMYGEDTLADFHLKSREGRAIVANSATKIVLNSADPKVRSLHPELHEVPILGRGHAYMVADGKCSYIDLSDEVPEV